MSWTLLNTTLTTIKTCLSDYCPDFLRVLLRNETWIALFKEESLGNQVQSEIAKESFQNFSSPHVSLTRVGWPSLLGTYSFEYARVCDMVTLWLGTPCRNWVTKHWLNLYGASSLEFSKRSNILEILNLPLWSGAHQCYKCYVPLALTVTIIRWWCENSRYTRVYYNRFESLNFTNTHSSLVTFAKYKYLHLSVRTFPI